MQAVYSFVLILSLIVAIGFAALIFITGKGDAMSGGSGSIRTTFKGKASFDDQIARVTLILGFSFMVLMLILDFLGSKLSQ
jgi:preprotein translocase subunit SecG